MDRILYVLSLVSYKRDWSLRIGQESDRLFLQWIFLAPNCKTGQIQEQASRKWFLSPHMTNGELVQTAFAAALAAEEHEAREFFLYDGARVFNPHLSLAALVSRADMEEAPT